MRKAISSKLRSCGGETLVETLVSTLIIAAIMLMLCTAIVAAARVNTKITSTNTAFNAQEAALASENGYSFAVTVDGSAVNNVNGFIQNGYVFYETARN